ncbi:3-hydroxyacyl-ACP dehydratase FabZ family protein [Amycolatopsis sp. H20-H5]|uniref:3-hydroxyacyl-ACP dehydratase FabZ family protein n=1 Tax=Amycolatopsis sp. H20-H5 TaxID=3046309 RepID=UPI002DB5D404|nr:hotdog domain-containing protein [Amycolatopsis sp. H20-H5]MEC3979494.1 hotdog domain-containing protein [Amycolatopsis sp. H20-H5]
MIGPASVRSMLPHRYPMLLVDRILEVGEPDFVRTVKAVTINEPWYSRLGPDASEADLAYPEFLLIESWTQTAGILAKQIARSAADGQIMLFGSMNDVEFHRPVFPGDLVEHHARLYRALNDTMIFEGTSRVGAEPVLTVGRMTMAFRPGELLSSARAGQSGSQ